MRGSAMEAKVPAGADAPGVDTRMRGLAETIEARALSSAMQRLSAERAEAVEQSARALSAQALLDPQRPGGLGEALRRARGGLTTCAAPLPLRRQALAKLSEAALSGKLASALAAATARIPDEAAEADVLTRIQLFMHRAAVQARVEQSLQRAAGAGRLAEAQDLVRGALAQRMLAGGAAAGTAAACPIDGQGAELGQGPRAALPQALLRASPPFGAIASSNLLSSLEVCNRNAGRLTKEVEEAAARLASQAQRVTCLEAHVAAARREASRVDAELQFRRSQLSRLETQFDSHVAAFRLEASRLDAELQTRKPAPGSAAATAMDARQGYSPQSKPHDASPTSAGMQLRQKLFA